MIKTTIYLYERKTNRKEGQMDYITSLTRKESFVLLVNMSRDRISTKKTRSVPGRINKITWKRKNKEKKSVINEE